jgi:hypothetical protein
MSMNLNSLNEAYGDKIRKNKMSAHAIAKMTGLDINHARTLGSFCRRTNKTVGQAELFVDNTASAEIDSVVREISHDKENYYYNEDSDTYITHLPNEGDPIILSGDKHRDLLRNYSNFTGSASTINQIARSFGMKRSVVIKYLRAHGITHDSEPFTPEEIQSRPTEDLIAESLEMHRAEVFKQLEKAKWLETQRDAKSWRAFREFTLNPIQMTPVLKDVPKVKIKDKGFRYAAVLGLSDFHWGKYSDALECGSSYDRSSARETLFKATKDVLNKVCVLGRPEEIIVPVGSDFLHVDTSKGTTTVGTQMDVDGTPQEILVSACYLLQDWVNTVRQVAPVRLILMSGNHDRLTGVALLMYLEALYSNCSDVTVETQRTPRSYVTYGNNLIGFVHGDGANKTQDLAGLMAQENASKWGSCPHRTVYTGHLHFELTETTYGVTRRQLPSLAGTDRWHSIKGYTSPKVLPVYVHDYDQGTTAIFYSNQS